MPRNTSSTGTENVGKKRKRRFLKSPGEIRDDRLIVDDGDVSATQDGDGFVNDQSGKTTITPGSKGDHFDDEGKEEEGNYSCSDDDEDSISEGNNSCVDYENQDAVMASSRNIDSDDMPEEPALQDRRRKMTKEELEAWTKSQKRRGVVYLSTVPPYMRPAKLKHILSMYGDIDRIYLKPEDEKVRKKRKRFKGNPRKKYVEGWVEFLDKKIAKRVAAHLNGNIMGGKKSNYYHDDIWSLKYLPKFKWHNLSERMAYEKAARESRLRAEISQVHKETNQYLEQVVKSKEIDAMRRKRTSGEPQKIRRVFQQHKAK